MSLRKLLYKPLGKAGEYANKGYAANIFKGCTHGCKYCYVPSVLRMDDDKKNIFASVVVPAPDVYARIDKDLKRLGKLEEPIFLCFTCDPYPADLSVSSYTRDIIAIILDSGNSVNILTKGGTRAVRDFDMLSTDETNKVGSTLTFFNSELSLRWEPGAAAPVNRVDMLRQARERGIFTWASIEPVIVPSESLKIMELVMPHVDEFKIGKWNHSAKAKAIDWRRFAGDVIELMEKNGKRYVLKEDLKKFVV